MISHPCQLPRDCPARTPEHVRSAFCPPRSQPRGLLPSPELFSAGRGLTCQLACPEGVLCSQRLGVSVKAGPVGPKEQGSPGPGRKPAPELGVGGPTQRRWAGPVSLAELSAQGGYPDFTSQGRG